ncbi:MAG TPA: response regulator [Gemmatimonadales bacterium]|jgi:CheY-like chemotaxis protein
MFLGTQRVARLCQVTPATVAHWIDQGHLKGHRTPTGHRRVAVEDLVAFLRDHGMPVPPEFENIEPVELRDAVVVVEDDPNYRKMLLKAIQTSGLPVDLTAAPTGMDGLLEIGRAQPAVILLDFSLPDLDAAQLVERLLAPGRTLDSEVLIVTAGVSTEDIARLHRLGIKVILEKAAGLDAVLDALGKALERHRARA